MQDRIDAARAANRLGYDRRIYFLHQMQAEMDEILNNPSLKAAHSAALDARTNIVFDLRGMGSIRISNESLEAYERALTLAVVPKTPPQVFKRGVIPKSVSTYTGDIQEPEALPKKALKRGITMPTFDNMFPPMGGGAGLLTGFENPNQVPAGLTGVYQELVAIRSAIPSMGSAVVNAANQGSLAQAQIQLAGQIKQQINDLNRLAIQYAGQVNAKPIEAQLVELNKRSFGMQASLGGYGATQYSAIGSVLDPIRDMTDRMRQGERITQYQQQEVMRQASYDRARIALDPHLAESVKRNYSSAIATEQRRLQDIGRFNVLELPRGMPDEGVAGRFPGLLDRFQGMQGVRKRIEDARDATGRLRDDDQRALRAQLDIEQRLLRVDEQRIRAAGDMTKEVQHQFNVQNSEINRSRRDLERAPTILTAGGAARMAAMGGGRALFGAGLQQLAFERGDVGGTGSLAMLGGLIQQRGIGGALIGGAEGLGARGALGLAGMIRGAPLAGSAAGIVGGLGSMAMLPIIGGVIAAAGGILSQVGPSTQHGMEVERLFRAGGARGLPGMQIGGIVPGFISGYYNEILNAGAKGEGGGDLAFNRDQILGVAGTLAGTGGTQRLGRDRIRSVLEFARYMGTDAQATAAQFGRQEAIGNTDTKRFADTLANSLAQTGLRGREQEVLGAVTDLTTTIARRGGTVTENQTMTNQVMGLLTAVGTTGVPGLQGAMGAQALGRMDQSITGATGIQRALLYGMYRNQPGGPQNFNKFIYEQALGVGSQFAPGAVNQTMGLAGGDVDMGGILIGQMFGLTPQQGRALAQLSKDKRLTNESMQQAINTGGGVAGVGIPVVPGDQGHLGNAEGLSDSMIRLENTFEDMASALQPAIEGLTNIVAGAAGIGTKLLQITNSIMSGNIPNPADILGEIFGGAPPPKPPGPITPPPGAGPDFDPNNPATWPAVPPVGPDGKPIAPVSPPGGTQRARPGAIYGPERGFPGYFLPKAEGGFVVRPGAAGNLPWGGTTTPNLPPGAAGNLPWGGTTTPGTPTLPSAPEPNLPGPGEPPMPTPEPPAQQIPDNVPGAEQFQTIGQGPYEHGEWVKCGPTTMAMILTNAGMPTNPDEAIAAMTEFMHRSPMTTGGMAWDQVDTFVNWYANRHGNQLRATRNPTGEEMLANMESGQPVMFSVNTAAATRWHMTRSPVPHIIAGVSAANGVYTFADPATNARYTMNRDQAAELMQDTGMFNSVAASLAGRHSRAIAFQGYGGPGSGVAASVPALPTPAPSENAITGGGMIPGLIAQVPRGEPLDVGFGPGMLPRLSGEGGHDTAGNPIASPGEQATYFRLATQMALAAGLTPNEALLAVAMGASESNFGNSPTNNILGMKAWQGWVNRGGNVLDQSTWEVRPGNSHSVEQGSFIAFQSHWDAFRAFNPLLGESMIGGQRERIAAAVRAGTMTPAQAAEALSDTHYQTDTAWPTKIRNIVERVRPYLPSQEGPQSMVPGTGLYGSVPMGADALGAQQQMFTFAFQPATITLVDPSGNVVGSTQIAVQRTDAQSMVDRDLSISSNGYTNGNAVYTGGI